MNAWLIIWHPLSERIKQTIKSRIAAILPSRTGEDQIQKVLQLLYANYSACSGLSDDIYVSEQVRFAKRDYPAKAIRPGRFPILTCGGNPLLRARQVFNLSVSKDEEGYQVLRWEENVYPTLDPKKDILEQLDAALPFKRKRMMFAARRNIITRQ
jgi:hypothetical protein